MDIHLNEMAGDILVFLTGEHSLLCLIMSLICKPDVVIDAANIRTLEREAGELLQVLGLIAVCSSRLAWAI
jgi:hypothetical protein